MSAVDDGTALIAGAYGWTPRQVTVPGSAAHLCPSCLNEGHVCENHPDRPWEGAVAPPEGCGCGGAGMPCPTCCDPIPPDGRHSIREAFTPRHLRQH